MGSFCRVEKSKMSRYSIYTYTGTVPAGLLMEFNSL